MKKILLCILSSILLILSFPKTSLWFLAWISLVPLFAAIQDEKPLKSFLYGIFTGLIFYCGILYWLATTFSAAGESIIVSITVLILLSFYLAIYFGLFCLSYSLLPTTHSLLPVFLPAFTWVSLELIRTHLFTGFPWALLGYTQWNFLPIIQISEFTGVYGISFLIVITNLTILKIINERSLKNISTIVTCFLFLISLLFGFFKLNKSTNEQMNKSTIISILQGNIDQYKKWDNTYEQEILDTYSQLANLCPSKTNLIIWPESAIPEDLVNNKNISNWIKNLAKKTRTQHLVGSNVFRNNENYTSAFLISNDGKIIDEYSKIHLVPFGEYVPLRHIIGKFVKAINEIGEFTPGKEYNVINSAIGKIGVNICFETIFPNETRKSIRNGAEIIVNITNDAWYLKTSAPYQHFTINIFRAVENRREVIRAANTGISGFIDSCGRVRLKTNIFTKTILTDSIQLSSKLTFYTKHGDIFAYICTLLTIIILVKKYFNF
ncbi:MAG: apolipoprotein N-acyltransferase [Elusimicrobia bacterium]|nr:apolipoprotein N-acyltransferase [Elusimicrobiota bacterium]